MQDKPRNLYLLDSTQAEDESLEEELDNDLGMVSRDDVSKKERGDGDDIQDDGEDDTAPLAPEKKRSAKSQQASDTPKRSTKRVALIAASSVGAIVVGALGLSLIVTEQGEQMLKGAVATVLGGQNQVQEPVQSANQPQPADEFGISNAIQEVGRISDLSTMDRVSQVLHNVQVERLIMGEPRIAGDQLAAVIGQAASELGAAPDQVNEYTRVKTLVDRRMSQVVADLRNDSAGGAAGVSQVIDSAIEVGFSLGVSLPRTEIEAIAKESALMLDTEVVAADRLAQSRVEELTLLEEQVRQARQSSSPDRDVATAISSIQALREEALTLDQKGAFLSFAAQTAELTPTELEKAAARVESAHQAQAAGLTAQEQQTVADVAAADIEASAQGLSDYQAAMFIAQSVPDSSALTQVVAHRSIEPDMAAALGAHLELRNQSESGGNEQERVGYIAASVAGAARSEGAATDRQVSIANSAITYEADQLGLSRAVVDAETARLRATVHAQDSELSELEIMALGERAAVIAQQRHNNLTDSQLQVMGEQALRSIISSAGFGNSTEREMIARSLSYAGTVTPAQTDQSPFSDVIASARREADEVNMSSLEREAYVAKALAEAQMEAAGHEGIVRDVAAIQAQAKARAQVMGMSESRQREIGLRAARSHMQAEGISNRRQTVILSDIDTAMTQIASIQSSSPTTSEPVAQSQATETVDSQRQAIQANNAQLSERLSQLEQRMASLSVRLTETISLAEQNAQQYSEATREIQANIEQFEGSVNEQLSGLEGTLTEVEGEAGRLRANFGWLSNRMCEAEAAAGTFSNPRACEAIYAEARENASQANRTARTAPTRDPAPAAAEPQVTAQAAVERSRPVSRNDRTMGALPATAGQSRDADAERIYASLPGTQQRQEQSPTHVSQTACDDAVDGYRYVTISEHNALIANQWGATQRIVRDSYLPELGAVIHIQARHQPRFVMFENGIVCR